MLTPFEKQSDSWVDVHPPPSSTSHGVLSGPEAMKKGESHVAGESYLSHVKEPVRVNENNVMYNLDTLESWLQT